jgi:hypothetical protein
MEAAGNANSSSSELRAPNPSLTDESFVGGQYLGTYSTAGSIDTTNPFFQSLGTNGRSCATCHVQDQGWSIRPSQVQQRFSNTNGSDPIFSLNDGANSPLADVSTLDAKQTAFSMLLDRGLIRVGLPIPPNAEFTLAAVDDPFGYASAAELSLFRRPLPSANLKFLSTVMWDGRETFPGQTINFDLLHQANDATRGHAQATLDLSSTLQSSIVNFETGLYVAEDSNLYPGNLYDQHASGGSQNLSKVNFYLGINDPLGNNPTGAAFNPNAFTLYDSWTGAMDWTKSSIANGQKLFNSKPINITGVKGLNDVLGVSSISGTCTTCHDTPNVGNHSFPLPIDIGISDASRRSGPAGTPDLPLYTLVNKTTGEVIQTTDPGRALITGKWADIGKFKGPVLRGLIARAPYFHNGSADSIGAVVDFYNARFNVGITDLERTDLINFLKSL